MRNLKKTKLDRLLETLSDQDWHWGDELAVKVGHRFEATIKEARNQGFLVETERVELNHRYRLLKASVRFSIAQHPKTLADLTAKIPQILEQVPYLRLLVLFGSRARGDYDAESDWDFAFLCDEEQRKQYERENFDFLRVWGILQQIYGLGDDQIDAIDLRKCSDILAHNIAKDGQVLYEFEPGSFKQFQQQKLMNKEQLQSLRDQQRQHLRAALEEFRR